MAVCVTLRRPDVAFRVTRWGPWRLGVRITLLAALTVRERGILEAAARRCPVCASLGPDAEVDLEFLDE